MLPKIVPTHAALEVMQLNAKVLSIMGKELPKTVSDAVATAISRSRVTQTCGCLLSAMSSNKEKSVIRSQVQAELQQFRGWVGKGMDKSMLPPLIWDKAQAVLKCAT